MVFSISGFFIFKLLGWNPCVLCISIIFGELVMPQALSMILLMPSPAHYRHTTARKARINKHLFSYFSVKKNTELSSCHRDKLSIHV